MGGVIAWELRGADERYFIVLNPHRDTQRVRLPEGEFYRRLNEEGKPVYTKIWGEQEVPAISCAVFKGL